MDAVYIDSNNIDTVTPMNSMNSYVAIFAMAER